MQIPWTIFRRHHVRRIYILAYSEFSEFIYIFICALPRPDQLAVQATPRTKNKAKSHRKHGELLPDHLRLDGHGDIALGAGGRVVHGRLLGMDVAVQLVVEVVVALVLQRGAAGGALEALHVEVLVLDADENATGNGGRKEKGFIIREVIIIKRDSSRSSSGV